MTKVTFIGFDPELEKAMRKKVADHLRKLERPLKLRKLERPPKKKETQP